MRVDEPRRCLRRRARQRHPDPFDFVVAFVAFDAVMAESTVARARAAAIVFVGALVAFWQHSLARDVPTAPGLASMNGYAYAPGVGLCSSFPGFFYFYYYFGQLPVGTSLSGPLPKGRAGAERFVADHGRTLVMDYDRTCAVRCGDLGKIFMYLPGAMLVGGPDPPSVRPFNELVFIAGLVSAWVGLAGAGYPLLGLLLALLVGSDPFQLFQAYGKENVFSLPISVALVVLGLHVRLLVSGARVDAAAWATAVLTGALLAVVREMRAEAALIGISALATYLAIARSSLRTRLFVAAACLAAYGAVSGGLGLYFEREFRAAQVFVERAGGRPYRGPWVLHHPSWHNILVGFGDFDAKYGFVWDDRTAYAYAAPILRERYGKNVTYAWPAYYFDEMFARSAYRLKPEVLPEYNAIVREKVLDTIRNDPGWYVGILWKRLAQVVAGTTPFSMAGFGHWASCRSSGWIFVPALLASALARRRLLVGLLLFTLPLALPALLVFSGGGMTHFGVFHLVAAAVLVQLGLEFGTRRPADRAGAAPQALGAATPTNSTRSPTATPRRSAHPPGTSST